MLSHVVNLVWTVPSLTGLLLSFFAFSQASFADVSPAAQPLLSKRAFVMLCPGVKVTAGLPRDYGPHDFDGVTQLCYAAGCECAADKTVQCNREQSDVRLYDTFSAHCQEPWCRCSSYREIAAGIDPRPTSEQQSEESVNSPSFDQKPQCLDKRNTGWCTSGSHTHLRCCEGYQCIPQPRKYLGIILGIKKAVKVSKVAIGICVAAHVVQHAKTRSLEVRNGRPDLTKRKQYNLVCPQELARLDPTMFSESSRTALWLCRQAGCLCLDDDNVHCSIDRAASTTWAYARFAAKCETPAWCTCEPPGKSRTKKPDGTRYIELPERIASEVCLRKGQPGYCLPGVPKGEPNLCCDGLQCLEEPLSSPSLQLGIQKTLEFGLGTCVDSLNSRSAQPKRAPPAPLMICPRSVPTEVSSSVPKTVKDLFGLCHAAGCFCYLDGKVYCTIQRAVLWHIYARYAHDCENKWCTCSEIREATDAAKTCSKNLEAAWSGYLATLKTKSPCCEGNQLVPQVSDKLGVLYGVSQAIGFAKGLIVGICVDSTRLASGLSSRSMETTISSPIKLGSSSELHKRMLFEMQCTEVLEERPRPPGRLSPITLLCQRVGCKCLVDGHLYCSLDRAESFPVYAEFASRCEQPEWCTRHSSGQSTRLQTTNSEACLQAIQSVWSLPPAPSRKDIPRTKCCCDSSQFIAHLPDKLILLYGLQRILESAAALVPGICIISQNTSARELTFRTNRVSHLHPTKRAYLELRCDEIGLPTTGYPTRFYNANRFLHLFDLCFQVGCRCGFDDRVHCAVDRAEDIHLWAAFHLKCETDQWCQCHDPKLERKPVSEITVQSDRKETPGSPSVGNWCSPPSPNARTPSGLTCSADQYCIPWSDIELSVQYGVEMAISPGICFLKDIAASIPAKRDLNLELGTSPNTSVSAALRKRQGLPASAPATVEKRALTLDCPGGLPTRDNIWPDLSTAARKYLSDFKLLGLCKAAGCLCMAGGSVGCSLARAEFDQVRSGAEVYALFAAKCETPAWCTCKQSLQQSGPILIPGFGSGGGFSNPNNCVGSDGAGGKHRSGWCLSGEEGVCCQGLRCVQEKEEVIRKSSLVLWGIEMLTGVGSCVSG